MAFDISRIEKSAKRANKQIFELQREQYATTANAKKNEVIEKEHPESVLPDRISKDLELRIRWLEKHKLNKGDFEAIGSKLLKMKTSVEYVQQMQKWTTQAVETILLQVYRRNQKIGSKP